MVISPLSIYHILSLTANGANSKTLKGIMEALCNKSLKEINDINMSIYSEIYNYKTVQLANAIFTQYDKNDLKKEFLNKAS
jgi:serpin B